jgi:hypothetical protein
LLAAPAAAQDAYPAEGDLPAQPAVSSAATPIPPAQFDKMIPKHSGQLGVLAPANIARHRGEAAFDVTGTWFIDLREGFSKFMFGPPYPKFFKEGREALIGSAKARAEGKTYRDAIGQCYPPGMPMVMTRVWPQNFIQIPTAIFMISGFNNSVRTIFLDGREHTDPDIVVPSYNGESIGRWEGDELVIDTQYFPGHHHWMDQGGAAIPASEDLHIVERVRMVDEGQVLEIAYTMTDPKSWKGEWKTTKRFGRVNDTDLIEAECLPDLNENLPGTSSKSLVR